jgi:VWFA-related protein
MRPKALRVASTALILIAVTPLVWSQIRTRVELVEVPVTVRDQGDRLVAGLPREEFVILEDGKPQTIADFSTEPQPLSAAIVIDDGMGGESLRRLAPLFLAVTAGFTPEDEMAAFRYDHFVWKLSDFSNDPAPIHKSFEVIAKIAETRPAQVPPGDPAPTVPGALGKILGTISIGSNGPPPAVPSASDRPKPVPTSRVLHSAIRDAAAALRTRSRERRKIIFIISDGQVSGANEYTLEQNLDFLLRNEIQVYAVTTDYALFEGSLGVLSAYARATGGETFNGGSTDAMETAFARITEQARNQYVLGYYSTNEPRGSQGVFREIEVRTRNSGFRVSHRRGYFQYPPP